MRNALLIFCSMAAVILGGCRTATDTMDDIATASTSGTYGTSGGTAPTGTTSTSAGEYGTTGTTASGTTSSSTGGYGTTGTAGSTTATGTYGATTAAPGQVHVTLTEYRIEMPDSLPAGRTTFHVVNYGRIPHSFGIRSSEADTAYGGTPAYDRRMALDLATNQSSTWEVDLRPGTYMAYCPVTDHATTHQMVRLVTVR